jgi:diadenosine tetraphosphate (Ap4A) HIT family hydrolase
MTQTTECQLCAFAKASPDDILFQDELWLVRSISSTPAVAGWLILQARRHIPEAADMNAAEAATFGPALQRFSRLLREVTGALRIYTASFNEGTPHFHTHLLPRLPEMPNGVLAWQAFGLSDLARRGEVLADPDEVRRVLAAVRERSMTPA